MRALLHTLLIAFGATALFSGCMLVLQPDGSVFSAPLSLLDRTPFADFFWPGLILGGLFGIGSLLASLSIAWGWRYGFRFAQVIGAGHVIWILFQLYWFPETSVLQPVLATVGLAIFIVADRCRRLALQPSSEPR
ncbi:MAG: hypothetical protein IPL52_08045 [Flavobacteriales bacterium]|nr:hypothetical protein [Flavobacteriales bacterium]